MQPARRRPRPEVQHPDSQRWQTTLSSDLERVAKQLEGSEAYDTTKRMAKVKATKMANQVTSISFGNEIVRAKEPTVSCLFVALAVNVAAQFTNPPLPSSLFTIRLIISQIWRIAWQKEALWPLQLS